MENNKHHDYKDTIREAAELDEPGKTERLREQRSDAEFAYEALAVTSSMGQFGQEDELVGLMQLQLAQELLYKFDPQTAPDYDDNDGEEDR